CFQAEDGIVAFHVTGVQTCALPISHMSIHRMARMRLSRKRVMDEPPGSGLPGPLRRLAAAGRIQRPPADYPWTMKGPAYRVTGKIGRASCSERVLDTGAGERLHKEW